MPGGYVPGRPHDPPNLLGKADLAAGLWEANDRDAYVITAEPESYAPAGGDDLPVIAL